MLIKLENSNIESLNFKKLSFHNQIISIILARLKYCNNNRKINVYYQG